MPQQGNFLHETANGLTVDVLKTYDVNSAHETFRTMDKRAFHALAAALEIEQNCAPEDIPRSGTPDYEEFLWDELCSSAVEDVRLDSNLRSFFIVSEVRTGKSQALYVAADWPSAERFARERLAIEYNDPGVKRRLNWADLEQAKSHSRLVSTMFHAS